MHGNISVTRGWDYGYRCGARTVETATKRVCTSLQTIKDLARSALSRPVTEALQFPRFDPAVSVAKSTHRDPRQ